MMNNLTAEPIHKEYGYDYFKNLASGKAKLCV